LQGLFLFKGIEMSTHDIFILFFLLFTKHYIVDFILQTIEQVRTKGIWGHPVGFSHSLEQGIWTAVVLVFFTDFHTAVAVGIIETHIHYITDWCKMRFGEKNMQEKLYWIQLGGDQYVHYLTYLAIIFLIA
jgi:hypothetical protein